MLICLPLKYLQSDEKKDNKKLPMNPYLMIVPAFFDVLATILDSFGLVYVSTFPLDKFIMNNAGNNLYYNTNSNYR